MSNYIIDGQNLTAIADAIRAKNGTSEQYTPTQMANAINNLPLTTKDYTVTLTKGSGWIKLVTLDNVVLQHINDTNFQVSLVNTSEFVLSSYTGYAYFCGNKAFCKNEKSILIYGFAHRMTSSGTSQMFNITCPANNTVNVGYENNYYGTFRLSGSNYYIRPGDGFIAGGTYLLRFSW